MGNKDDWMKHEFEKRLQRIEAESKRTALRVSLALWLGVALLVAWIISHLVR